MIPDELREPMGRQVFGCDICQDVCPWNRRAPISVKEGMEPRTELVNPSLAWLGGLDAAGFRRYFKGSPLERTRRKRLHRNVAIAMGNSRDRSFLPQLEAWSTGEDEVLAESARWAIRRITGSLEDAPWKHERGGWNRSRITLLASKLDCDRAEMSGIISSPQRKSRTSSRRSDADKTGRGGD